MGHQEPPVATFPASGRGSIRRVLPLWRPRWRVAGIAVIASVVAAAVAMVASAERDVYLRTHPRVPDLVGKTVAEAARMMVPLHFGVIVAGSNQDPSAPVGVVLAQQPLPGLLRPIGSVIQLKVSQGSGVVPRLRGDPVHEAAQRLERVGLRLGRVQGIEDDAAPGTVLEQFTPPGHRLDANSPVDVLVSQRPGVAGAVPPGGLAPSETPSRPLPSAPGPPSGIPLPVPAPAATRSGGPEPSTVGSTPDQQKLATPQQGQEGGSRVGSAPTNCTAHSERERVEVCHQPADDGGTESDLQRPEHRGVPLGP